MRKNSAAHATMAENAAPDQCAREHAVIVATVVRVIVGFVAVALESAFSAQKVGEERPTHTSPPQRAARDEYSYDFLFVSSAFLSNSVLAVIAVDLGFALGAKEVSEKHATHATAPQHSAPDQRAHELLLVAAVFAPDVLGLVAVRAFTVLVQETGDECSTNAPILQRATPECESSKLFRFRCGGCTHWTSCPVRLACGVRWVRTRSVQVGAGTSFLVRRWHDRVFDQRVEYRPIERVPFDQLLRRTVLDQRANQSVRELDFFYRLISAVGSVSPSSTHAMPASNARSTTCSSVRSRSPRRFSSLALSS
jgi:hypothetical protein